MRYIIDLDALKDCLELLSVQRKKDNLVDIEAVKKMIDKFPKEEFKEDNKKTTTTTKTTKTSTVNEDVLDGKGLKPINKK